MISRTSTAFLAALAEPHNEQAWRRFDRRYRPRLLAYGRRVGLSDADAADAAAATLAFFVQAYRDGRYERDKGRLKSWLGGIIQRQVLKLRQRRRPVLLDDLALAGAGAGQMEPASDPAALDAAFEHEWRLERLSQAVERLKSEIEPETYQAFDLYAVKGLPPKRVADFLGVTVNAVYISKTRVVQRLREIVRELEIEEDRESPLSRDQARHALPH